MRLRGTLILVLIAALILPWAGWQLVKQMEALLREGQERAQIAAAQALSRALNATSSHLPEPGPTLYVHDLSRARIVLDGSGDDWALLDGAKRNDARLSVVLGEDAASLYALITVADTSRRRVDAGNALGAVGDAIDMVVSNAQGLRRYRLGNAAPGVLQVSGGGALDIGPTGEWQETDAGYRIELRLPRNGATALGFNAIDVDALGVATVLPLGATQDDLLGLVRDDREVDTVLAALVPEGARVRFVSNDGWVLGRAGELRVQDPATPAARRPQAWIYRLLLAPPAEAGADFAGDLKRLNAPVVWQALSGLAASSVRASTAASSVIVSAAVPVQRGGQQVGALVLEQSSDALLVLANKAVFGVMAASLLAVLLASLILFGYAGVLSVRIRRLRNAAERALRPDGRLETKLPHLAASDDLGDLSRSFARLLGEVGAYNDYLKTLASKLSHELHTPLAIVRSSLDNLEHEQLTSAARTYAQRARVGAERLTGILRSMAEASRMERAIQSAEGEDFDITQLVRGCAEAYRDLVLPRRLQLDVPASAVSLHGAPDMLAQALDKLVDNARSFTPEDGWIRLRLSVVEHGVELAVANNGPPLPERMQERLFDSLVSVREGAGRSDAPHLGLGLFVVRLIADLHEGEARAVNLGDGAGVEFRLRLKGMPRARRA